MAARTVKKPKRLKNIPEVVAETAEPTLADEHSESPTAVTPADSQTAAENPAAAEDTTNPADLADPAATDASSDADAFSDDAASSDADAINDADAISDAAADELTDRPVDLEAAWDNAHEAALREAMLEDEADDLPTSQRKPIWPLIIAFLITFILATGGLTFVVRTTQNLAQEEAAAIKAEGDSYLNDSIASIQEADATIVSLNEVISTDLNDDTLPQYEAVLTRVENANGTLDSAVASAELARSTYTTTDEQNLAQAAIDSALYKKQLLEYGSALINYDLQAWRCQTHFDTAAALISTADSNMIEANNYAINGDDYSLTMAIEYNNAALEQLNLAETELALAKEAFPQVDTSAMGDFIAKRKESVTLAIESDQAILDDDYDTANAKTEEFNTKEAEAFELYSLFAEDYRQPIRDAYEKATSETLADYHEAWANAADRDAVLREYTGMEVQVEPSPTASAAATTDAEGDGTETTTSETNQ
ncbi:MAG: hypothetical protein LBR39_03870 [Coriobacteriales bacterium]|jgi:hypothetical protein|nr:hypothetical protein [Coriobacteriales bacterium]